MREELEELVELMYNSHAKTNIRNLLEEGDLTKEIIYSEEYGAVVKTTPLNIIKRNLDNYLRDQREDVSLRCSIVAPFSGMGAYLGLNYLNLNPAIGLAGGIAVAGFYICLSNKIYKEHVTPIKSKIKEIFGRLK